MHHVRRATGLAAGASALALLLTACGGGESGGESAAGGGGESGGGQSAGELLVWHGTGTGGEAAQGIAAGFGEENGVDVTTELVAGDTLQTNFVTASQGGTPPDVVCGAHDWIGNLVQNGAIDPIQLTPELQEAFQPLSLEAVTYNGQVYGMPYTMNNLVLYRNTALAPEAPATLDDLVAKGKELQASGQVAEVVAWPVGQTGNAYFAQPLFTSGGGYIFGEAPDGGYTKDDLGVGAEGSVQAGQRLAQLGEAGEGVLKRSVSSDNATTLFTEGQAPFLVEGPWQLPNLDGVDFEYAVSPVPGFAGGQTPSPFITVDACYVASGGANKAIAQEFVTNFWSRTDVQAAFQEQAQAVPANVEVLEQIRGSQPLVAAVADAGAATGKIMPSLPEMAAVFDPLGKAEAAIIGGADPQTTMTAAGDAIRQAIGG